MTLDALLHTHGTDLYVFNDGCASTEEIVAKAQILVHAWHKVLQIT